MAPELKLISGQRTQLEKELVESLFTGQFDKRQIERLKRSGVLTVCSEPDPLQVSPAIPHQSNEDRV